MSDIQAAFKEVGRALRRPEELTVRWRDRAHVANPPTRLVFPVLLLNAALGLAAYGVTMGLSGGAGAMLLSAFKAPLAAGLAWTLALPALYIINTSLGSKLDLSTTALAALATVSFGALAMLASVPVSWFFFLAIDAPQSFGRFFGIAVDIVVFTGVAICMLDVFMRVMKALEPSRSRGYPFLWLSLVGVIGLELMLLLNLF